MADSGREIALTLDDLRAVTRFAAESAQEVLEIFESVQPSDRRPREAIGAAWAFARGGKRGKSLRDTAWAAQRGAHDAGSDAAASAARSAMAAAGSAYLHPLADAAQVKHVLLAAAYAARASELAAGDDSETGSRHVAQASRGATPAVRAVLSRYPAAPPGGGRVGQLVRDLDALLRSKPRRQPIRRNDRGAAT